MADKGGLQLLPEARKRIELKTPGENRLLFWGSAVFALVLILMLGLYLYRSSLESQIADLDNQLAALEQQRDKNMEKNLLTADKQFDIVAQFLGEHILWSQGLSKAESLLQNQIQFTSFSGSLAENKFMFKALANNYTTIARQIASFLSDPAIKDVALNSVNVMTNGKLEFNMQLDLDAGKFLKSK